MDEPKYLPIREFRDFGYLQEINRRILHPLGLALAVSADDATGETRLAYVIDGRDDAEGFFFDEETLDPEKTDRVVTELARRAADRISALGYVVQPARVGDRPAYEEDRPPE